jgi:hypothetical protein
VGIIKSIHHHTGSSDVIYRKTHSQVANSFNIFVTNFANSKQRSYMEDSPQFVATRASSMLYKTHVKEELHSEEKDHPMQSQNPDISYWTKDEWIKAKYRKKDSSDLSNTVGP